MDGYAMVAESYRIAKAQGKIDKETADRVIKIYDFLAGCSEDDIGALIDSGIANDYIHAYAVAAMRDTDLPDDTIDAVVNRLDEIFDMSTADEVLNDVYGDA